MFIEPTITWSFRGFLGVHMAWHKNCVKIRNWGGLLVFPGLRRELSNPGSWVLLRREVDQFLRYHSTDNVQPGDVGSDWFRECIVQADASSLCKMTHAPPETHFCRKVRSSVQTGSSLVWNKQSLRNPEKCCISKSQHVFQQQLHAELHLQSL